MVMVPNPPTFLPKFSVKLTFTLLNFTYLHPVDSSSGVDMLLNPNSVNLLA